MPMQALGLTTCSVAWSCLCSAAAELRATMAAVVQHVRGKKEAATVVEAQLHHTNAPG